MVLHEGFHAGTVFAHHQFAVREIAEDEEVGDERPRSLALAARPAGVQINGLGIGQEVLRREPRRSHQRSVVKKPLLDLGDWIGVEGDIVHLGAAGHLLVAGAAPTSDLLKLHRAAIAKLDPTNGEMIWTSTPSFEDDRVVALAPSGDAELFWLGQHLQGSSFGVLGGI